MRDAGAVAGRAACWGGLEGKERKGVVFLSMAAWNKIRGNDVPVTMATFPARRAAFRAAIEDMANPHLARSRVSSVLHFSS